MDKKVVNRISEILEPTEEQKDKMFNNILDKYKDENKNKRGFTPLKRLRPRLVAVMVAFCLITTTAFAASYLGLDIKFLDFLNPSSNEQAEYLAKGASIIGKQVKNKDGTIEFKQVIGDSNVTLILVDFTAPDGTVLNKPHYSFKDIYTDILGNHGFYSYGFISLEDEDIKDNKTTMVLRMISRDSFVGKKIHLKLTDLQGADTIPGDFTTIVSGAWETRFNLDFKDYSANYEVDKVIKMFDYDATIDTISISPISVVLKLKSPFTEEIKEAAGNWEVLGPNEYSDIYPITIKYKDGTSETTDTFNGMHHLDHLSGEILFIKTFENVINDKEIQSITFFDTEIPIIDQD